MISYAMRVPDWTPEQVADWFLGLGDLLRPYAHAFLNNDVDGRHLVILCSDDLHNLSIWKLGHQELILEAVEHLGQSYFHLDAENLQWLALRLSCKARSLYNELPAPSLPDIPSEGGEEDRKKRKMRDHVATSTLSAVADVVASVKSLMCWLDGPPFEGQEPYSAMRTTLLQLAIELAMNAQRDQFAEEPNTVIRTICHKVATMCDNLIQESRDPLILQPASLDVATIRKKPNEELGMHIQSLYCGSHVIGRVKYQSPASSGGRVERGDEIVQVNYRTVVGWTLKKLVFAMKENPLEVVLTLKKRPKHSLPFGRIFPQHFLFAAKTLSPTPLRKTGGSSKWCSKGKAANRLDVPPLLPPPPVILPLPTLVAAASNLAAAEDDDDDSAFLSEVDSRSSVDVHLAVPKLQVALQRRATVTGASPTTCRPPVSIDQLWHDAKRDAINRCCSYDLSGRTAVQESTPAYRDQGIRVEPPPPLVNMLRRATCTGRVDSNKDVAKEETRKETVNSDWSPNAPGEEAGLDKATFGNVARDRAIPRGSFSKAVASDESTCGVVQGDFGQTIVPASVDANRPDPSPLHFGVSFGPESNADEAIHVTKEQPDCRSYEVVAVGGVAHTCSAPLRDVKRSPLPSPALRHKMKRWEFASRRISCKDLGQGDCEGWLYRGFVRRGGLRSRYKWNKRWCVLKADGLFVYVDQQDLKAECFICLVGFSISPAPEYKSKKYAFRVYHSGTEFYFASGSQQDMSKWMNKMGLAAISFNGGRQCISNSGFLSASTQTSTSKSVFFSESEDELEDANEKSEKAVRLESAHGSSTSLSSSSSYHSTLESPPPTVTCTHVRASQMLSMGTSETWLEESTQDQVADCTSSFDEVCEKTSTTTQTIPDDGFVAVADGRRAGSNSLLTRTLPLSSNAKRNPLAVEQQLPKALSLEWGGSLFNSVSSPDAMHSLPSGVGAGSEPTVKLSLAFEMNLDSSPPCELLNVGQKTATLPSTPSTRTMAVPSTFQETSRSLKLSAFKLFGSPKFVKRLAGYQGGADVKPLDNLCHSVWFDEQRTASSHSSSESASTRNSSDKRLLGSPRLARAFFRAIHHKKAVATGTDDRNELPATTDTSGLAPNSTPSMDYRVLQSVRISSIPSRQEDELSVGSTSVTPAYSMPNVKHFCSSSLDSISDIVKPGVQDVTRTSLKPAMGVSMIGKQRRSSTSQSEPRSSQLALSGHHHQPVFASMASQGTQTDSGSAGHRMTTFSGECPARRL